MKCFFLLLMLLCIYHAEGQNNFKPIDSSSVWTGRIYSNSSQNISSFSNWLKINAPSTNYDTLIGNQHYTKLYRTLDLDTDYYCAFRSDTIEKTIYMLPKDSSTEYLFFDFDQNLSLGDTLTIPYYDFSFKFNICQFKLQFYTWSEINNIPGISGLNGYQFENISSCLTADNITIMERLISEKSFPFMPHFYADTIAEQKCYTENNISILGIECPYNKPQHDASLSMYVFTDQKFTVYPNPAQQKLQFKNIPTGYNEVSIFNLQGQLVEYQFLTNDQNELNIDLASGIYYLKLSNQQESLTQKIIIQY